MDLSLGMLTLVEPEGLKPQASLIAYGGAEAPRHPKSPQLDCLVQSAAIRFHETDHLMLNGGGLFQIHQMSGTAEDNAFRSGDTRLNGYPAFPNARARIAMRVGTPF